ncbi:LysM domain-containing protein [Microcoleus sp. herbarium14]|uniref:LysM peptidoglycan-binding domain-containing protein n=1 Tax=Microcoleus sp. herbarium14 TaxID=3055439 RepID=UPI002FCF9ECA
MTAGLVLQSLEKKTTTLTTKEKIMKTHTVAAGDTFSSIAAFHYGNGSDANAQKIAGANPGVSAGSLQVGQTLQIPA